MYEWIEAEGDLVLDEIEKYLMTNLHQSICVEQINIVTTNITTLGVEKDSRVKAKSFKQYLERIDDERKVFKRMVTGVLNSSALSRLQFMESDDVVMLKQYSTNFLQSVEKAINEELDFKLNINSGSFAKEITRFFDKLSELKLEKRLKSTVYMLHDKDKDKLIKLLKSSLQNYYLNLCKKLDYSYDDLQEELNQLFSNIFMSGNQIRIDHALDFNHSLFLSNLVKIERNFESLVARKNWMDHIIGARKYQMLFFMIVSTFGLSFLRQMKWFMVPVSLCLVSWGFYSIIKSNKTEEEENKQKELLKASELLKEETRRIISEFNSKIRRVFSDHLRAQSTIIQKVVDNAIITSFQKLTEKEDAKRKKATAIHQQLEIKEKEVQLLIVKLDNWLKLAESVTDENI